MNEKYLKSLVLDSIATETQRRKKKRISLIQIDKRDYNKVLNKKGSEVNG